MYSVTKSHLTLWNPMDCSPPGSGQPSSVLGISQASILEWVAISFSTHSLFPPCNQELQRSSPDPLHESQPCRGDGACVTQWRHETCYAGPPKWAGQRGEFWQNVVHWRREWQTTSVFLPWEPHEQQPNMLLEISWEITPERMKRQNQSQTTSTVDVTGDRSKVWCCKEQYCIGSWNVRSMNQGKLEVVQQEMASEGQHFRNQWTKMDWDRWI